MIWGKWSEYQASFDLIVHGLRGLVQMAAHPRGLSPRPPRLDPAPRGCHAWDQLRGGDGGYPPAVASRHPFVWADMWSYMSESNWTRMPFSSPRYFAWSHQMLSQACCRG